MLLFQQNKSTQFFFLNVDKLTKNHLLTPFPPPAVSQVEIFQWKSVIIGVSLFSKSTVWFNLSKSKGRFLGLISNSSNTDIWVGDRLDLQY